MRFKNRRYPAMPEMNLVPMMDVLMTVLTFFIIISMTLATQQGVQVQLPNDPSTPAPAQPDVDPLRVKLTPQGILLEDQPVTETQAMTETQSITKTQPMTETQLKQQMQLYLASNSEGFVVLQADPLMPYEQVLQLLGEMKELGGDRVSLSIDQ